MKYPYHVGPEEPAMTLVMAVTMLIGGLCFGVWQDSAAAGAFMTIFLFLMTP